ncbi:MAG TPA: hypothetical protein VF783_01865 [Terriglobales bacterium]
MFSLFHGPDGNQLCFWQSSSRTILVILSEIVLTTRDRVEVGAGLQASEPAAETLSEPAAADESNRHLSKLSFLFNNIALRSSSPFDVRYLR